MRIAIAGGTGTVGRHVTARAQQAGHEAIVLSRSRGVNLRTSEGLSQALKGIDVVIDVSNPNTFEQAMATEFFTQVAGALQHAGAEQGLGLPSLF